ncbi:homoserine kinase [Thermoflavimicrobium dichotomicum]|uniref:Homoserine kinase n=1 Tax=Thermoflavimicrobium dichotomicum TaxID=46223 RepID=A0A1I3PZ38_9BACL|nr:homoserine kinase [Thermoflavimicrobium dichotomicum]SFJ26517.1 homoserine kinase [Thermoflavimicrobium dichotomicum]
MNHSLSVQVKVPASTANLGPGFDTMGMAFQLYTTISMQLAETTQISLSGQELQGLPHDKSNLLYRVAADLFTRAGLPQPELTIEVSSDIPLTRGLGSSAAAIVGALVAANQLAGEPFTTDQLFALATHWEGHPDNVGASLFGGIVVAAMPEHPDEPVPYLRLPAPPLQVLVTIPDFQLATAKARSVLPKNYPKSDVIYNIGRSSLLVAALAQGRFDLLKKAMRDRIHQPYRAGLVPGLDEILEAAPDHGALGVALSGAGPTILCFYQTEQEKQQLSSFIADVMAKREITYRSMSLLPDSSGVQIDTSLLSAID